MRQTCGVKQLHLKKILFYLIKMPSFYQQNPLQNFVEASAFFFLAKYIKKTCRNSHCIMWIYTISNMLINSQTLNKLIKVIISRFILWEIAQNLPLFFGQQYKEYFDTVNTFIFNYIFFRLILFIIQLYLLILVQATKLE